MWRRPTPSSTGRTRGQLRRHLAPTRPARATARRRCCCRCPAAHGRSACGGRRRYPLLSHMAERGWVCVSIDYRVSPETHLARPHRRRQARAGVDQGEHRRIRRRPRLRRDHRRFGGRASVRAGRADTQRPAVAAGFRGRRHLGGGGGADLRPLRLVHHARAPAARSSSRSAAEVRRQETVRRAPAGLSRRVTDHPGTPRRAAVLHPARHRTTRSSRCTRGASSPRRCSDVSTSTSSSTPRSRTPSTRSTSSGRRAVTTPREPSRGSCRGCTPPPATRPSSPESPN